MFFPVFAVSIAEPVYALRVKKIEIDTAQAALEIRTKKKRSQIMLSKEATNWRGGYLFPTRDGVDVVAEFDRGVFVWHYDAKTGLHKMPGYGETDVSIVAAGKFGVLVAYSKIHRIKGQALVRTEYSLWEPKTRRWKVLGGVGMME